ncbi:MULTISPECIES: MFS transporter [unclassified Curtobacterium]|uniref:MFS transporter n=1 Tax=unclassified Curtobacterium TaxID=257496 RepID=UPI0037F9FB96
MAFPRQVAFAVAGATGAATLTAASAPSPLYPVYQHLFGFSAFTLTVVFAVYVGALLVALLTVGSLSDRIGRRPVSSGAMVLLALGMLLFVVAGGTGGLVVARVVQGFAVGAATGTVTAMILDAAPDPRRGSIVSSAVPSLGITIGAVLAGALVEFAPFPRQLVFWVLAAAYLVLAAAVWWIPERSRPAAADRGPVWRSLLPSAALPPAVRPAFLALVPSIIATWALSGLSLSLGSSVIGTLLEVHSHFVVGLVLGAFFVAGTIGGAVSTFLPSQSRQWFGYGTLAVGVVVMLVAVLTTALPLYVVGSAIAGLGFGSTFQFAVTALGATAPPDQRGQVFATMYIVSYAAFSVPALVAGLAAGAVGLEPTVLAYGVFVVVLVLAAVIAALRSRSAVRTR